MKPSPLLMTLLDMGLCSGRRKAPELFLCCERAAVAQRDVDAAPSRVQTRMTFPSGPILRGMS